ncbi:hypothetical protein [Bacteroides coprosuis]|nr:hypothetical protein [Bacteroides coprosuis]HJD92761.1 hypothetical protein [Bacteroides coprosuis]
MNELTISEMKKAVGTLFLSYSSAFLQCGLKITQPMILLPITHQKNQ